MNQWKGTLTKEDWKNSLTDEKSLELFQHMPNKVFESAHLKKVKKDGYVVEKEQEIESILICCKGDLEVRNEFRNGTVYNFAVTKPISYIGVMEILADRTIYSAYLQTKSECELLIVPKQIFFEWFYKDQWLMLEVLKFVSKSMFERSWNSGEHRMYPANYRVVRYLVECFEEAALESIFIQISKEEMSRLFCISTRTLHRVLKELKETGIITVNRRGIGITKEQFKNLYQQFEEMRDNL
ncbi:MAG: Crp/Fnr family transcriptional regulator [Acetivibrio sp.]